MNTCKHCGRPIPDINKYCNNKCQNAHQNKVFIAGWLAGTVDGGSRGSELSLRIKNYLLNEYLDSCQLCGWGELNKFTGKAPLEIHHIDGNSTNNNRDNLQLLCPNCHALTDTYGRRGQGRKQRYK